jgi:formate dehydrogenase iron-sulfur subunit
MTPQLDIIGQPSRSAGCGCGSSGGCCSTDTRRGDASEGLLARLLREQQTLTAVEEFSRDHDAGLAERAPSYSKLMPAAPPAAGQQYAFEVDLDRCSGCKACVSACHSLNGLDEDETWRDVGLLIGGTGSNPLLQHVTTACHHCLEPGCMSACPVDAYEKDPVTGIVRHLDDQCFGCQYCTLACPYDVPKYHAGKGIVRKCDMCSDRLAHGEPPACVQACPHEAIAIRLVDVQQIVEDAEADPFLPGAPDPQITLPTTHFKTARVFPRNTLPVDYYAVSPQHPHWPLIIMLVLTQLSVGAYLMGLVLQRWLGAAVPGSFRPLHASTALGFGLLALAASTLHLGRPQYAFRAVIGLRHSWLSREIVSFGAFAAAAGLFAAVCWLVPHSRWLSLLEGAVALSGIAGVLCSVMIYVVTGRECWSLPATAVKFALTAIVLGIAAACLSMLAYGALVDLPAAGRFSQQAGNSLLQALVAASAVKLAFEASALRHLWGRRHSPLKRSAQLLAGPLAGPCVARFACGLLGGVVMPLFVWHDLGNGTSAPGLPAIIGAVMLFAATLAGELLERYLFFAACAAPRMPGRLRG